MGHRFHVRHGESTTHTDISGDGVVEVNGERCQVIPSAAGTYRVVTPDGRSHLVTVAGSGPELWASLAGKTYALDVEAPSRQRTAAPPGETAMTPPMPSTVVKVVVEVNDRVAAGDPVVVLEAMKMELTIRAAHAGTVRVVRCAAGDLVRPGMVLVEIEP